MAIVRGDCKLRRPITKQHLSKGVDDVCNLFVCLPIQIKDFLMQNPVVPQLPLFID